MRLNADLIARAPAFISALKDREIDLRGNKIALIENLAALQDQFDSVDLSDNEIRKLECMAVLPRLKMLLLSNNRISRIAERLSSAFPHLETLVLTNNQLSTLKELEPISSLATLTNLSLVDNPVTKQPSYRAFVVARLPHLRTLDFQRVTAKERAAADALFGAAAAATAAAAAATPAVAGKAGPAAGGGRPGPSPEQITLIKQAIANAASLDEVAKLEKLLKASDYDAIAKHLASEAAKGTLDDGGDGEADATEANGNGGDRGMVDGAEEMDMSAETAGEEASQEEGAGEEEEAAAAPEAPDAPPDDMET